jgi:hypothetical protein
MAVMALIGRNRRGTGTAIRALGDLGRLERVDQGLVDMARATADLFDRSIASGEKTYATAAAGRLHLTVLLALMGRFPESAADDADATTLLLDFLKAAPLTDAPIVDLPRMVNGREMPD